MTRPAMGDRREPKPLRAARKRAAPLRLCLASRFAWSLQPLKPRKPQLGLWPASWPKQAKAQPGRSKPRTCPCWPRYPEPSCSLRELPSMLAQSRLRPRPAPVGAQAKLSLASRVAAVVGDPCERRLPCAADDAIIALPTVAQDGATRPAARSQTKFRGRSFFFGCA